jgi:hypothetical protein
VGNHLRSCGIRRLQAVHSEIDVSLVGSSGETSHGGDTWGTEDLEGILAAKHPWGQHQVGKAGGVIGVKVGDEDAVQPGSVEPAATFLRRSDDLSYDPRPTIDKVCGVIRDDGDGWSGAIGLSPWRSGSKKDHFQFVGH